MTIEVRRGTDRFVTRTDWLTSRHSFSFGPHYDASNTHHGALLALNDDVLAPGGGFDKHSHRDVEIITWVIEGAMHHTDSLGNDTVVGRGNLQRTSAGSGIEHSERNASDTAPLRYVQMWLRPDGTTNTSDYSHVTVDAASLTGRLTTVVGDRSGAGGSGVVSIGQSGAAMSVARLRSGDVVSLPEADYLDLFVVTGVVRIGAGRRLEAGDELRATSERGEAGRVEGMTESEILVWEMERTPGG